MISDLDKASVNESAKSDSILGRAIPKIIKFFSHNQGCESISSIWGRKGFSEIDHFFEIGSNANWRFKFDRMCVVVL